MDISGERSLVAEESVENTSVQVEESEEEEEELTASKAFVAIENAWINEKFAPEILPYEGDLVDCMLQQVAHMESNMKHLRRDDLRLFIHKMELQRIRFVISSYLRLRLEKIERYAVHILSEEARREPDESHLSPSELKFAKDYLASMELLFRVVALRHMPWNFQEFEVNSMLVKPNLHSHVFVRAVKRVEGIVIPGTMDHEVTFEAGSQHIIQYKAVADLVKSGVVQLI